MCDSALDEMSNAPAEENEKLNFVINSVSTTALGNLVVFL